MQKNFHEVKKMSFVTINPYTEEIIRDYQEHTPEQTTQILNKSNSAFHEWKNISLPERALYFRKLSEILLQKKEYYAQIMTEEMGHPITGAVFTKEVERGRKRSKEVERGRKRSKEVERGRKRSKEVERGREVAEKLEVGFCAVNDIVKSDPRLPFGGIKNSGYGRELSHHGIKEFINIKPIYIK